MSKRQRLRNIITKLIAVMLMASLVLPLPAFAAGEVADGADSTQAQTQEETFALTPVTNRAAID